MRERDICVIPFHIHKILLCVCGRLENGAFMHVVEYRSTYPTAAAAAVSVLLAAAGPLLS